MLYHRLPLTLGLLSIGQTTANWPSMSARLQSLLDDNEVVDKLKKDHMIASDTTLTMTRTIAASDMSLINEYGCWCYFENDHYKGRSTPVDDLDQLCKQLHDGYSCAMIDSKDLGQGECVPWEVVYNSAVGSGLSLTMDMDTINTECEAQNPTQNCAQFACKVEAFFVQELLFFFVGGGQINAAYRHANGFDPNDNCKVPGNNGVPNDGSMSSSRACCNEYPLRFPYKTYDGARECCVDAVFDSNLYACCNDGVVRVMGAC